MTPTTEKSETLSSGTRIRTASMPDPASTNWAPGEREKCQWGVEAKIHFCHSHSGIYRVEHADGVIACYDPSEVTPI